MKRKKIHFNLQSSHVLLCGVCLNVDVTFAISNGSKWVGKQWKSQRNGNVWVGALAQWGDLSSFISHQFGVWCRQNARHLLDMSNCTVLKEGNAVKSMQLQPFALTQSINDLFPLNDSSPCRRNKKTNNNRSNRTELQKEWKCWPYVKCSIMPFYCHFFCSSSIFIIMWLFEKPPFNSKFASIDRSSNHLFVAYFFVGCHHRYVQ